MKSKYFLNLSNSVEKISHRIKNLFKNDIQRNKDFTELTICLHLGKLEKFEEFFYKRYDPRSFYLLAPAAVSSGKLEVFIKLEKKGIELNKIHKFNHKSLKTSLYDKIKMAIDGDFYGEALYKTMSTNNKEVLEYLIDNKHISSLDITDLHIFRASCSNSDKVLQYILYDLKYQISDSLMKKLKCDDEGITHTEIIELIEKRDLLFELDKDLNEKDVANKPKLNKI